MNPAGALRIQIDWDGKAVLGVGIVSTRPRAAQLLCGLAPDKAVALLPMLYSICGRAQQCAGQAAVAAARGQPGEASPETAFAIMCEAAQEHLWRLLLDWPRLLGLETLERDFSNWYRRLAATAKLDTVTQMRVQLADFGGFVESTVFGMPLAAWLGLDDPAEIKPGMALAGDLWQALADDPASDAACVASLPFVSAAEFAGACAANWDEEFERCPVWQGLPAETGALARWQTQPLIAAQLAEHGRGMRTRLLARLMDLARCAGYIAKESCAGSLVDAYSPVPGIGIARVETARGTLLHRVGLEDDAGQERVKAYLVVAPTEWNFHPRGAFVAALQGFRPADEAALRRQAHRLVLAFDPCVAFELKVHHA